MRPSFAARIGFQVEPDQIATARDKVSFHHGTRMPSRRTKLYHQMAKNVSIMHIRDNTYTASLSRLAQAAGMHGNMVFNDGNGMFTNDTMHMGGKGKGNVIDCSKGKGINGWT